MGVERGWAAAVLYNTPPAAPAFTHVTRGWHLTLAQPECYWELVEGKRGGLTDSQRLCEAGFVRAARLLAAWI